MKWIKASERLPAEYGSVHWRDEVTKLPVTAGVAYRYAISENDSAAVEWLDESSPPTPQPEEGEDIQYCKGYELGMKRGKQYTNSRTEKLVEALEKIKRWSKNFPPSLTDDIHKLATEALKEHNRLNPTPKDGKL